MQRSTLPAVQFLATAKAEGAEMTDPSDSQDALLVVCRALGVPSLVRSENRLRSAAAILLRRAEVLAPVSSDFRDQHRDAGVVVETFARTLAKGELDHLMGDYPGVPLTNVVQLIANRAANGQSALWEPDVQVKVVSVLMDAFLDYVRSNPLDDWS